MVVGRLEQVLAQHGSQIIKSEPEARVIKIDQRQGRAVDQHILAQHIGVDRAKIAILGMCGQAVAQIGAGGLQHFGLRRSGGRVLPKPPPERAFPNQPINIPAGAGKIGGQGQAIRCPVQVCQKAAQGAVFGKNLGNRFVEGNSGLAQSLALYPVDHRGIAPVRQPHQKPAIPRGQGGRHRNALLRQGSAPPKL